MDPQTLPAPALELYDKIRKRYKRLAFEPLQLGDIRLNLLKITDLEQILDGRNPLEDVSAFPFWVKLWEASIVLAEFLVRQELPENTRVLELGAGLGAPSLAAAASGCRATLTDYEETILDFGRVSAAASRIDNMEFRLLDWLKPPRLDPYDVVLGAEVLFREEFFEPLLQTMDQCLKPDGVVYLAHDVRRQSLKPFLQMAEKEYRIAISRKRLRTLEEDREILLTRLVRR